MINKPYNTEYDNQVYLQYSQDIIFDYSTGRFPTGDEPGFYWENNYIPITHDVNAPNFTKSGPHVWKREKVGKNSKWSLPQPIGVNSSNFVNIIDEVLSNVSTLDPIYINEDYQISHKSEGYQHLPINAIKGQVLRQGISEPYWDNLNEYYTKSNLIIPGQSSIHVDNVIGIQEDPITDVIHPLVLSAGVLSHEIGNGTRHLPSGGSVGQILVNNGLGQGTWVTDVPFVETDPIFTAWDKSTGITITESQITDLKPYLTSFTEVDPIFSNWEINTNYIVNGDNISNLVNDSGYITEFIIPSNYLKTGNNISELINDANYLTSFNELDPVFTSSEAFNITAVDITNLSNLSGINTGDQDLSNYVDKTTIQTIDGEKTFLVSPIVPTPTTDYQATNKSYVDSLTKPETLETSGWWSTLNTVSENILALDLNRTQLFIPRAGTISKIKFYIESLGSNPNSCKINFTQNGLDLLASNHTLTPGWNTLTTLQNNVVAENIEFKLAVRTASGSSDIGDFKIQITLS